MITLKTSNNYKYINDANGMVMVEFIIMLCATFVILAIFIQIGYILKSEAVLIAVTRDAVRQMNVTGKLDTNLRDQIKTKLNSQKLEVSKIHLNIDNVYFKYIDLDDNVNEIIRFRQDFVLSITVNHPLRTVAFNDIGFVKLPLGFGASGRGEVWTPDSLIEIY